MWNMDLPLLPCKSGWIDGMYMNEKKKNGFCNITYKQLLGSYMMTGATRWACPLIDWLI